MLGHRAQAEFSHLCDTQRAKHGALAVAIDATADERKSLAAKLGVLSLDRLGLKGVVVPEADGRSFRLRANLSAEVVQACVVSLEPVRSRLEQNIERKFVPAELIASELDAGQWFEPDMEDAPDPLLDGQIDLGAVAVEELVLAINPYPRAPGATFPTDYAHVEVSAEPVSPFAVLKRLTEKS